ncbi:hypothetical protein [Marinoscillum furvescens]|uniref:Uncharacterized protein n=1 Tax=Marinoscillum furvescens DSM 4134 TaxID=1122208 RepID=A0A3D9L7V6_MARFU|nr:hypothetical protein [Marinoscillum furvescens]REE01739.1 hypothetical protein C7460_103256 [Marinoscillum furvescens DSM 4134]
MKATVASRIIYHLQRHHSAATDTSYLHELEDMIAFIRSRYLSEVAIQAVSFTA